MEARDLFFSEVCDAPLEREPFTIETAQGPLTVYAEEIDDAHYIQWQQEVAKAGGDPDAEDVDLKSKARLLVKCVVTEDGRLFFKPGDVDRLAKGRVRYVDALYQLCLKVNRLGSFANLKKKSAPAQPSTSCCDSAGSADGQTSALSLAS